VPKPFDEGHVSPKGWWSNKEILCVWDLKRGGIGKLIRLDLTTGQVSSAASSLRIPETAMNDVSGVDITSRYLLIQHYADPTCSDAAASYFKLGILEHDCAYSTDVPS